MKKGLMILAGCMLSCITCTKDQAGPDGCFQEDVLPVLVSNCTMAGCHNGVDRSEGYDFSNYEGVMKAVVAKHPLRSELYKAINGKNPAMPPLPYKNLSAADISMIKLWINMGARNTSNCRTCDTVNFNYSNRINKIMQAWCVGCHNGSAGGGYNLTTYMGAVTAAAGNKLLGSIKHSAGFIAMPQTGGRLPDCDIAAIQKWIEAGFPQ